MKKSVLMVFLVAWLFPLAGLEARQTVRIAAAKDSTLIESPDGALANGAGPVIFVGRTAQPNASIRRGLIAFDIAAAVPQGATITKVTLSLHKVRSPAGPTAISLHRVLADWGSGAAATEGGKGAPAQVGDSTWLHRFFDENPWTNPGGDFSEVISAVQDIGALGSQTWTSTPQLVADVQSWLDTPTRNFGWLLLGNEAHSRTVNVFSSREHHDPSTRPELTIDYQPASNGSNEPAAK